MIKITLDILGKGPRLRCLKLYVGFLFNLCEMPKIISCLGPDYTGHWCMTTSLEIFFFLYWISPVCLLLLALTGQAPPC